MYLGQNVNFTVMYTVYNVGSAYINIFTARIAYNVSVNDRWDATSFETYDVEFPIHFGDILAYFY